MCCRRKTGKVRIFCNVIWNSKNTYLNAIAKIAHMIYISKLDYYILVSEGEFIRQISHTHGDDAK